ncbi:MAG TPA: LPS assembly lipoprotein LptE [Luteimonas sp.]|nr:LPS assembly lipoprotein LptE [Luteimonas sp.]HRO25978.1 LPS assembly lipoprotein LptE [Luteimonas sp.]HRP72591.1 LPS assembly lipoprotein LptE [Luteimonas sp.]
MIRTSLFAVLVALALSACGFHLRGALKLPPGMDQVQVTVSDPYSPLRQSLERSLTRAGAGVVEASPGSRVPTLAVRSERWSSVPVGIDQFGRAQEYSLRYAVVFALTDANGDEIVPQQAVELSRDYISVPDDTTGTDTEAELLGREMQREMTASILRRIDAATRQAREDASGAGP